MAAAVGDMPSIKVERDNVPSSTDPYIKPDPDLPGASPAIGSEEDIYEDPGDLDFSQAKQPIWLTRIPKYLWEDWSEIDDDQEIQLGTVRIEGGLDNIKRVSLLLSSDVLQNQKVPKEYNIPITNEAPVNTYIFTEKDLPGYESKLTNVPKPGSETSETTKLPPIPARIKYLNKQKTGNETKFERGKRWEPYYPKAVPKDAAEQTTLAGHVRRELNCLPVENEENRRIIEMRVRETMKPKLRTRRLSGDVQTHAGNVLQPGTYGANGANFENFIKTSGKKQRNKKAEQRTARMPENELLDLIYGCFKDYDYWSLKALKDHLHQPEAYLKQVLEPIAQFVRSGSFAMTYMLRPECRISTYADAESYANVKNEMAPDVGDGSGGDDEDDDEDDEDDDEDEDEVKMEDVLH